MVNQHTCWSPPTIGCVLQAYTPDNLAITQQLLNPSDPDYPQSQTGPRKLRFLSLLKHQDEGVALVVRSLTLDWSSKMNLANIGSTSSKHQACPMVLGSWAVYWNSSSRHLTEEGRILKFQTPVILNRLFLWGLL